MAITDHGGYDIAIALSQELLSASLIAAAPPLPQPPDRQVTTPDFDATIHVNSLSLTSVDTDVGVVWLVGTFTGTATITRAVIDGNPIAIPAALRVADLTGTFRLSTAATIGTVAGTRGVVLSQTPGSRMSIDESTFLASAPIMFVLAQAYLRGGEPGYLQRRQMIIDTLRLLGDQIIAAQVLPASIVMPEPPSVAFDAVVTTAVTCKVLAILMLPGVAPRPPGVAASANALTARRNSLGGPLDHVGLVANNSMLLGSIARPAVAGLLGIGGGAPPFAAGHPCLLLTATPIALAGVVIPTIAGAPAATLFADFVHGFVNNAGLLQIDLVLRAVGFGALATVTTRVTLTASFTTTLAGSRLALGLGPPTVVTTTDVQISPALYLAGALTGGALAVTVLAAVDLVAGPAVDAVVRSRLPGLLTGLLPTFTIPLGGLIGSLTVTPLSSTEAGAPVRTIAIGSVTVPLDRAHDVTVRLA